VAREPNIQPCLFIYPEDGSKHNRPGGTIISAQTRETERLRLGLAVRPASVILVASAFVLAASPLLARQAETVTAGAGLPDAPAPQTPASSPVPKPKPCPTQRPSVVSIFTTEPASDPNSATPPVASHAVQQAGPSNCPPIGWYQRFVNGPRDKPLTPKDKAWLAARNMVDPFNTITILGEAGISVAADSHSPYGPGMPGYGRYVGVSYTQDLTGEFFGTFLIPTIVHQDPHYHRMPEAKMRRRIAHALYQVVWTQGDSGKGMPNYANLVGFAIDDEISNLYVPGRKTDLGSSASRYAIGLATAPIGNFIAEFLPDVARHIHVQIVIIQRVINQVARTETQ
jgi:hypothetical protein